MNARPLRSEVETRIRTAKQAFTAASVEVLQAKPNAEQRAEIALRQLNEARAALAQIEDTA